MLIVAFLFFIMLSVAISEEDIETTCKNDYRDVNNNPIDVLKYCSNILCIEKCCGADEILDLHFKCMNMENLFKRKPKFAENKSKVDYSTNILSSRDKNKEIKFVLVHNNRDFAKCYSRPNTDNDREYDILKNGSIRWQESESKNWNQIRKLGYCIDYRLVIVKTPEKKIKDIQIIIWESNLSQGEAQEIESFAIVAILISSFFLMLVLVVYCLLPDLRNLSGLALMAYTFSILFAFVMKLIQTFIKRDPPHGFCQRISPVVYFAFMSSIFWLSVLSFDVWWGLRSFRIKRGSKHGEMVKFMWYGLYAWGTPLLITAIVTMLDNLNNLNIVEPAFKDCLYHGRSLDNYFKIPISILIFINIVLFIMTVYNIWMVKRAVNRCQDSRSSKHQHNKFSTFAKLSVMMGVSWCLELLPVVTSLWYYILCDSYNLLTGVAIFYLFVCKKKILVQLCKKFNIRNDFIKKLESELSQHTKSGSTRTTRVASSIVKNRSMDENQEMELLKSCPKDESTVV